MMFRRSPSLLAAALAVATAACAPPPRPDAERDTTTGDEPEGSGPPGGNTGSATPVSKADARLQPDATLVTLRDPDETPPDAAVPDATAEPSVDGMSRPLPPISASPNDLVVHGFAKTATGGTGGREIRVGSLEEFRAAVSGSEKRIIKFSKGGVFAGGASVGSNVTIDGSDAPGPVTFKGGTFAANGTNVIIRHLRFRHSNNNSDLFKIGGSAKNVVVDHCSISWSGDENVGSDKSGGAENITIQNSLIAQARNCMVSSDKACGRNAISVRNAGKQMTLYRNALVLNPKGLPPKGVNMEVINNVIQGFTINDVGGTGGDVIGNVWEPKGGGMVTWTGKNHFVQDNVGLMVSDGAQARHNPNQFPLVPASTLKQVLAPTVGASLPCRDKIDARLVGYMVDGGGDFVVNSPSGWEADAVCAK